MIKQTLWGTYLVAAMATTPFSGHAEPVDGPLLRLHWEAEAAREGLQVVCGEVRNDGTRAAQHVRLLVEQLDGRVGSWPAASSRCWARCPPPTAPASACRSRRGPRPIG